LSSPRVIQSATWLTASWFVGQLACKLPSHFQICFRFNVQIKYSHSMMFKNSLSASWPVRELSSPRLDWPRVSLSASCPVSGVEVHVQHSNKIANEVLMRIRVRIRVALNLILSPNPKPVMEQCTCTSSTPDPSGHDLSCWISSYISFVLLSFLTFLSAFQLCMSVRVRDRCI